jgi:hypothetical protein
MTTATPKFELTTRHTALGFAVIASLCLSLAAGFVAHASSSISSAGGPELRASTAAASTHHAS